MNLISSSGTLAGANTYRFSSKEIHPVGAAGDLYYYGYRFYRPSLQRWLNRDPIEEQGSVNLYVFTENAPSVNLDAWGLDIVPSAAGCGKEFEDCIINANSPPVIGIIR